MQLLKYHGKNKKSFSEVYKELKDRAKEAELNISVKKTTEVVPTGKTRIIRSEKLVIMIMTLKLLGVFRYLVVTINNTNDEMEEFKARILTADKAYYCL